MNPEDRLGEAEKQAGIVAADTDDDQTQRWLDRVTQLLSRAQKRQERLEAGVLVDGE